MFVFRHVQWLTTEADRIFPHDATKRQNYSVWYCIIKSMAGFCLMKQVYGRIFYSSCKSMAVFLLHHAILYGRIFPHETSLWQDFFSMMQVYGSIKRHDYSALWILWKDYLKLKVGLFGKLSQQEEYFARYKYKTDYSFWYKMI